MARYIRWFDEITGDDVATVGGKNASLGELYGSMATLGIKVPRGFALTATAFQRVLDRSSVRAQLNVLLAGLDASDAGRLERRAAAARAVVRQAGLPDDVWDELRDAYDTLAATSGHVAAEGAAFAVAVRSSATAEDLPDASFAGQHESYLNVAGHARLREAAVECMASLFTARAISYRVDKGFAHDRVAISVGVQRMVRADTGTSGVAFTIDPETGFADVVVVASTYGLGETLVKGMVVPDEHVVFKPSLAAAKQPIVRRRLGTKEQRMVLAGGDLGATTRCEPTPLEDRSRFALHDADVLTIARHAVAIERHQATRKGAPAPMDIEWARDGETGEIFVVQARPETVQSRRRRDVVETYVLERKGEVVVAGKAVGQRIGVGRARVITSPTRLHEFEQGEVLVAPTTTPDWEPIMRRASAIVTDSGGRTCHAAIVARELGLAAVVGAEGATGRVANGEVVTVSCVDGDVGVVYRGALPFRVESVPISHIARPRTRIMMNLGDPSQAFALAATPCDGVGLARVEFILSDWVGVHPMALLHPERVESASDREAIARRTTGYADPTEFLIDRLAQGVATIAAAFFPRPVVVRLSDFKSSEYASLLGGRAFEPHEENPMLGLRGASRYTHPSYREAFSLECKAMRRVRDDMGLRNVQLMIPFCRSVSEGERVIAALASHGLVRGRDGLEVLVMCELPTNALQVEAFCAIFDGISIGSNDLTQLTLGVDRDSALVAPAFDERDPSVTMLIDMAVAGAHRAGRHASICGQAPADHPELLERLVRIGIDAISLGPDAVLAATLRVQSAERALAASGRPRPAAGEARA